MSKPKKAAPKPPTTAAVSPSQPTDATAAAQRQFFGELVKRERAAVAAFADFLKHLPGSVHLHDDADTARLAAIAAGDGLSEILTAGAKMMGLADE